MQQVTKTIVEMHHDCVQKPGKSPHSLIGFWMRAAYLSLFGGCGVGLGYWGRCCDGVSGVWGLIWGGGVGGGGGWGEGGGGTSHGCV